MKILVFDHRGFMQKQIWEALTCPINRHCTRTEHNCDDWDLFHHPEWLINHFITNGGAVEFAKRRAEFLKEIEVNEDGIEYEL